MISAGLSLSHTRGKNGRGKKYLRVHRGPQRGRYLHQLIAEAMMGRPLRKNEIPDHIDGNEMNCHPTNIRVTTLVGNSRKQPVLPLGETIFDGRLWWARKNPWLIPGARI